MDFYRKMALVCGRIPKGRVATYGQIALMCGKPRNARQVGFALKRGLAGEDIPAHRIVNARGLLAGAVYFDTPDLQRLLLEAEGVEVHRSDEGWKVDLRRYGWVNHFEDALSS
ncbi:MAG: cysteine methyltransferase [Lachnospiraceae bacterium]|nr:cysteine methyltransferase [Lachnospiraceae bacterium]